MTSIGLTGCGDRVCIFNLTQCSLPPVYSAINTAQNNSTDAKASKPVT